MAYTVGYEKGVTADPNRLAWRSNQHRPLNWSVWYPAAPNSVASEKLLGPPGEALFKMGWIAESVPLSQDQTIWPVVLLSHGTGGSAPGLCWLGHFLAARGFVAIGVSHHGNTAIEPYLPEGFLCWWERATDLTAILDWLASTDNFAGRLDIANVFAAGFSLGAYTVLSMAGAISDMRLFEAWLDKNNSGDGGPREFPDLGVHVPRLFAESSRFRESMAIHGESFRDARVRAVVALAPAPPIKAFKPESLSAITVPVHIISGKGDLEAPYDDCAVWLQVQNPSFELSLMGPEIGHYVFLPEATEIGKQLEPGICVDPDGVDRAAVHRFVVELAEGLFRRAIT